MVHPIINESTLCLILPDMFHGIFLKTKVCHAECIKHTYHVVPWPMTNGTTWHYGLK